MCNRNYISDKIVLLGELLHNCRATLGNVPVLGMSGCTPHNGGSLEFKEADGRHAPQVPAQPRCKKSLAVLAVCTRVSE